jgi:hypothetical protein
MAQFASRCICQLLLGPVPANGSCRTSGSESTCQILATPTEKGPQAARVLLGHCGVPGGPAQRQSASPWAALLSIILLLAARLVTHATHAHLQG